MNGLDKIKNKILTDAEKDAAEIISKAQDDAKKILNTASEECQSKINAIIDEGKKKAESVKKFAESSSHIEGRKRVLEEKGNIIDSVIEEAYKRIMSISDEEYFKLLSKLVSRYAQRGKGKMYLSSKDLKNIPENFEKEINKSVKDGQLEISKESYDIDGGFVLVYGGIEENCSFNALFREHNEMLRDKISAIIFG